MSSERYWPFEMPPASQMTPQDQREVQFLEAAYEAGYHPFEFGAGDYGAVSGAGRSGHIFVRGRSRWEIILGAPEKRVLSAYLGDFACAATAVLDWLHGKDVESIFHSLEKHLVSMPGARHRFVLTDEDRLNAAGERRTEEARFP